MISERLDPNNEPASGVRRVTRNGRQTDANQSRKPPLTNTRHFEPTTRRNQRTLSPPLLHTPRTSAIAIQPTQPPIPFRRVSESGPA